MNREEIKSWRQSWGLTQDKMARLLGVHRVTIAKWEAGDRGIPPFMHLALKQIEQEISQAGGK
jgi:DNA-binding XRE family transcriptional regulator